MYNESYRYISLFSHIYICIKLIKYRYSIFLWNLSKYYFVSFFPFRRK